MKHTEGKWRGVNIIGDNILFCDHPLPGKPFVTRRIIRSVSKNLAFEAPELLEALKEITSQNDDDTRPGSRLRNTLMTQSSIDKAKQVIKAAELK